MGRNAHASPTLDSWASERVPSARSRDGMQNSHLKVTRSISTSLGADATNQLVSVPSSSTVDGMRSPDCRLET